MIPWVEQRGKSRYGYSHDFPYRLGHFISIKTGGFESLPSRTIGPRLAERVVQFGNQGTCCACECKLD
jgi:hypothetical protein